MDRMDDNNKIVERPDDSLALSENDPDFNEYDYLSDKSIVPEIPDEVMEPFTKLVDKYVMCYEKAGPVNGHTSEEVRAYLNDVFMFAYKAHRHQKRMTGEPYIIHPIAVADILAELEVDPDTIAGALLHDTIEDTVADWELLAQMFSPTVANLVDGVTKINTKLGLVVYDSKEELQATNVRKMVLAMTDDVRIIFIKLADRLHNMRTLKFQTPEKQVEKARETLDIYVPFAGRFGIYKVKWELEDLCLRFLDPDGYNELVGLVNSKRSERETFMEDVVTEISARLSEYGFKHFEIEGRPKHFYSIYKKMKVKGRTIDQIYDLYACRIIVDELADCYTVLGIIHEMYQHIPGRFKDYIAMPKENKYQSIHTTVMNKNGTPFEVQIRTYSMHQIAEYGIAAHWHYKESGNSAEFKADKYDSKMSEMRQLIDSQGEFSDTSVLDVIKDISGEEIFVYTPKGKVVRLPAGSCPIDFAYAIHSGIGNHMHGAKVNGRMVALNYELKSGEMVEILDSPRIKGPSKDWVNIVRTSSARSKINAWFKKEQRAENIVSGKDKLNHEIERNGFVPEKLLTQKSIDTLLSRNSFSTLDDLYAAVGYGSIKVTKVFGRLRDDYIRSLPEEERAALGYRITSDGHVAYSPSEIPLELGKFDQTRKGKKNSKSSEGAFLQLDDDVIDAINSDPHKLAPKKSGKPSKVRVNDKVEVEGLENVAVHLSKCCHPVYGDAIIGYVTQGAGVGVHKVACNNIINILSRREDSDKDRERFARLVKVKWLEHARDSVYSVCLKIRATDKKNIFFDIVDNIKEEKAEVVKADRSPSDEDYTQRWAVTLTITGKDQLDRIIGRIRGIPDVLEVERM